MFLMGLLGLLAIAAAARAGSAPEDVGRWQTPRPWPVVAIHAAMLPNGNVLTYAFPQGTPGSLAMSWNPHSGEFAPFPISQNLFCSGLTFLDDGSLLAVGGTGTACETSGLFNAYRFDAANGLWSHAGTMTAGRWYPTVIRLGTGQVLIFSGDDSHCSPNDRVERFTPGDGIELMVGAEREIALFPNMHLLSSGLIAHVGPESATYTFDPVAVDWQFVTSTIAPARFDGASVLLPGSPDRVMLIGGEAGGDVTGTCEIIDFQAPTPQWQPAAPLIYPRAHADAVILPDRTVLLVGGGTVGLYGGPIKPAELYDPVADTWTELPPQHYPRAYHSTTVLLPDGRVLSAGQDFGLSAVWGEVYEPAYLFRGPRPAITGGAASIRYGVPFTIETADAGAIESVVLVAPSAVTHSVNFNQRLLDLDFSPSSAGSLVATAPVLPDAAPPGPYMLFILDGAGVPSVARMVRLSGDPSADVNGDGAVDVADLVALILAWGPNPGHPADLDGDGRVGTTDLVLLLLAWDDGPGCLGEGDCCATNLGPGCSDPTCCEAVCAADPWCCDFTWDGLCANVAVELCECEGGSAFCGAAEGECCEPHDTAGCDDPACCAAVCFLDAFCCEVAWDGGCVAHANALCTGTCEGGLHDCCETGPSPGCSDRACSTAVCAVAPACCQSAWDEACVELALQLCGGLCVTCPGQGDCCAPNDSAGCDDVDCCGPLCEFDPYCCDVLWDQICATEAISFCGCPPPCSAGQGDCCTPNGTPGCEDVECCEAVCAADLFCCETMWDTTCAALASAACVACGGSDCCAPNGTPGCSDPECEAIVCAEDAFCCDIEWDAICGDLAGDLCAVCMSCGPGSGDCCSANGTPGCDDVVCCEAVCRADGFCCDTKWDQICADIAARFCGCR